MRDKPITAAECGRRGGLARAKKHSYAELSAWGRKGGRPPKRPRKSAKP